MPLPKRTPTETREKFIERCMSNPTMVKEFPDKTQRLAVCAVQWRKQIEDSIIRHVSRI